MEQRRLGRDGPDVSAIGLGAMSFAGIYGEATEAEALAPAPELWTYARHRFVNQGGRRQWSKHSPAPRPRRGSRGRAA